jgi:dTDP-glucose 4,6-dehydratase
LSGIISQHLTDGIATQFDFDSFICKSDLPEDDPKVRKPDIGRARKLLGWEPKVDRSEGLKRTLAYFLGRVRVS